MSVPDPFSIHYLLWGKEFNEKINVVLFLFLFNCDIIVTNHQILNIKIKCKFFIWEKNMKSCPPHRLYLLDQVKHCFNSKLFSPSPTPPPPLFPAGKKQDFKESQETKEPVPGHRDCFSPLSKSSDSWHGARIALTQTETKWLLPCSM